MQQKRKIVFLYSELAGYFLACIDALIQTEKAEVHLIRWPVNKIAPFQFNFPEGLHLYEKSDYPGEKLAELVKELNPSVLYCSGWMDKDYVKVCRDYNKKIPVIVGFDNQWFGGVRQQIARVVSPWFVHRNFNKAWVPGDPQYKFARKLGFKEANILTGVYSADVNKFHQFYQEYKPQKTERFPKKFIYVGRYVDDKGLSEMWQAFNELCSENETEWELWCLGTGELEKQKPDNPAIRHFGFVQPEDINKFVEDTGVFILPSNFEPWGVVVHEFAAAGFPIICSEKVGAETYFMKDGVNGYRIEAGNKESIKAAMKKMMDASEEELKQMGDESVKVALTLTPETWANKLLEVK